MRLIRIWIVPWVFAASVYSENADKYEPVDAVKIYQLEFELYKTRLQAEKKLQLKKLVAKEAAAAKISVAEWERRFFENNPPELPPEVAARLASESEQTRRNFRSLYEANLREKLWDDLSRKYAVRLKLQPPRPPVFPVQTSTDRAFGDVKKAPIRVVEFFDLECPHCREASRGYERLRREFARDIVWYAHHFPSESSHPRALDAHIAAECAGQQGKFFEFREILFAAATLTGARFRQAARDLNLEEKSFAECLARQESDLAQKIRGQVEYGKRLGIPGTPTLVVNDRLYPGLRNPTELRKIIRDILSERKR